MNINIICCHVFFTLFDHVFFVFYFQIPRYSRSYDMNVNMFSQIAAVTDHLFLSSAAAVKTESVRRYGITHIINCTLEIPNLNIPGLESIQIHVEDAPHARLGLYFEKCADKVHQVYMRGGRTLIHCVAGVSRSASLCIAYLMKYQRMTLEQAYYHVKKKRPVIHPNSGFWKQLIEYERRIHGRNTVKMVNSGVGPIPEVYKDEVRSRNMHWSQHHIPPHQSFFTRTPRLGYY